MIKILNESYFDDIEVNDDDIVNTETVDVKRDDLTQYQYCIDIEIVIKPLTRNGYYNSVFGDSLCHINLKRITDIVKLGFDETDIIKNYYIPGLYIYDSNNRIEQLFVNINEKPLQTDFNLQTHYNNSKKYIMHYDPNIKYKLFFNKNDLYANVTYQKFVKQFIKLQNILNNISRIINCSCNLSLYKIIKPDEALDSKQQANISDNLSIDNTNMHNGGFNDFYRVLFDNDVPDDSIQDSFKKNFNVENCKNYILDELLKKEYRIRNLIDSGIEKLNESGVYKITQVKYKKPSSVMTKASYGEYYMYDMYISFDVESLLSDKSIDQREFEKDFIYTVLDRLPKQYLCDITKFIIFRPVNGSVFKIPEAKGEFREGKIKLSDNRLKICDLENMEYTSTPKNTMYRKISNRIRTLRYGYNAYSYLIFTDKNGKVFKDMDNIGFYQYHNLLDFMKNELKNMY